DEKDLLNPLFSPLLAEDLSGLPYTIIITAEYDPLRDQAEAYAYRLMESLNTPEGIQILYQRNLNQKQR
ncbi:hypothetical protein DJ522_08420, partial [Sulfolobus sp. F3]